MVSNFTRPKSPVAIRLVSESPVNMPPQKVLVTGASGLLGRCEYVITWIGTHRALLCCASSPLTLLQAVRFFKHSKKINGMPLV